jgi:hypothetical protein
MDHAPPISLAVDKRIFGEVRFVFIQGGLGCAVPQLLGDPMLAEELVVLLVMRNGCNSIIIFVCAISLVQAS